MDLGAAGERRAVTDVDGGAQAERSATLARLCIVSHVVHYEHEGRLWAYAPYAREIDIWADLFPEVLIAAPSRRQEPPPDCQAFCRPNIIVIPQGEWGGISIAAKLWAVARLPVTTLALWKTLRRADAIHVRCPGNLGLVGVLLAPIASNYLVAKYAGQWSDYPKEPFSFRLQKRILRSGWWKGPVTVYGPTGEAGKNLVSFFTSVMNSSHVDRACRSSEMRSIKGPIHVVFVGRLSVAKNVDVLLEAVASVRAKGMKVKCTLVGDGPQRDSLVGQAMKLGISDVTFFRGALPFDQVLAVYEEAHVAVLASQTEGWPKAIAEAMAFGLVCIGSNRGLVPWMLGEGRGLVVPPRDVEALATALAGVVGTPAQHLEMGRRASLWARRYSIEGLQSALAELLAEHWGVTLSVPGDASKP